MRIRLPLLLLPVLLTLALPGAAQVYRCERDGAQVFSDRPCAPDSQPMTLPDAVVVPAGPGADLLGDAQRREQRERQQAELRRRAEAQWQADHARAREDAQRLHGARVRGEVVEGMTPSDVRAIHGEPTAISRSGRAGSERESWRYLRDGGRLNVVFVEGRVASVSHSGGGSR